MSPSFIKDLSANVPLYNQENDYYCGPACAQMSRNGYPNPADRLYYTQDDLWNRIQTNNSVAASDVASLWNTDPDGLTECLQCLSNPPGVHWSKFIYPLPDDLLFDIFFWMNRREFPVPVLINGGGHWVTVVKYETDVEPTRGSRPNLVTITVNDPDPVHNGGTYTTYDRAQWYAGPWSSAITYAGTWSGQYVAVVEPPIEEGQVNVQTVSRIGKTFISPDQAVEAARKWIEEYHLTEDPKFHLLGNQDVEPLAPALVRDEPIGRQRKMVPYYYIVPFGFRSEFSEHGGRAVRVCVLVNAYTGNFEEVTAFGKPMRYITREEVLEIVSSALSLDPKMFQDAQAQLVFRPSEITQVRTYPFWRVTVGKRMVFVDQLGKLFWRLLPGRPGD